MHGGGPGDGVVLGELVGCCGGEPVVGVDDVEVGHAPGVECGDEVWHEGGEFFFGHWAGWADGEVFDVDAWADGDAGWVAGVCGAGEDVDGVPHCGECFGLFEYVYVHSAGVPGSGLVQR